jgi:hypothetical protein
MARVALCLAACDARAPRGRPPPVFPPLLQRITTFYITFVAEPETTASPENENQRAPDLTFDNGALAEHNRALKRKPREAVAVANGCHRVLQMERVKAYIETKPRPLPTNKHLFHTEHSSH